MKAKLCVDSLEDYGNNLVQAQDNNANGINEMAYMLWDIITSCESKHTQQINMRHELMIMDWSQ